MATDSDFEMCVVNRVWQLICLWICICIDLEEAVERMQ